MHTVWRTGVLLSIRREALANRGTSRKSVERQIGCAPLQPPKPHHAQPPQTHSGLPGQWRGSQMWCAKC
eukprot:3773503-Prymnesium_polylepis.1